MKAQRMINFLCLIALIMYSRKEKYTFTIIHEEIFLLISFKLNIMHVKIGTVWFFWGGIFSNFLKFWIRSYLFPVFESLPRISTNNRNDERQNKLYNLYIFSLYFDQDIFFTGLSVKWMSYDETLFLTGILWLFLHFIRLNSCS